MRPTRLAALSLLSLACATARGQTYGARFLDRPAPGTAVRGVVAIRVSSDPFTRAASARYALQLGSGAPEPCAKLPAERLWDTRSVPDGEHVWRLLLADGPAGTMRTLDQVTYRIDNRPRPGAPVRPDPARREAPAAPPSAAPAPSPAATKPTAPVQRAADLDAPGPATPAPAGRPTVRAVAPAPRSALAARQGNAPRAAATAAVAAIAVVSGRVIAIRRDGTVTLTANGADEDLAAPDGAATPRCIAQGGGALWWLDEQGNRAYRFSPRDRRVEAVPLARGLGGARHLAWWRGKLVACARGGAFVVDPATGAVSDLLDALPEPVTTRARGGELWFVGSGDRALLAAVRDGERGATVSVFAGEASETWRLAAEFAAGWPTPDAAGRMWLGTDRVLLAREDGLNEIRLTPGGVEERTVALPGSLPAGERPSALAVAGQTAWLVVGGVIAVVDLDTGATDAYLPWNEPAIQPLCLAADEGGAWVGTNRGIRRLAPRDHGERPYGSWVRVPLGAQYAAPSSPPEEMLTRLCEEWQGAPYLWGGASKTGTDCSGFVMSVYRALGVELPHNSQAIGRAHVGSVVRDALRLGDVLVFPDHCAIYLGNGLTAETVTGRVGGRAIWSRREVVVRRFLPSRLPNRAAARAPGRSDTP
ncbi:MAG: C40 family peptidase [Chthonomonadales bacterium]|nr:C40 family peptidase [Chthonomonadales bacterium]